MIELGGVYWYTLYSYFLKLWGYKRLSSKLNREFKHHIGKTRFYPSDAFKWSKYSCYFIIYFYFKLCSFWIILTTQNIKCYLLEFWRTVFLQLIYKRQDLIKKTASFTGYLIVFSKFPIFYVLFYTVKIRTFRSKCLVVIWMIILGY